MTTHKSPALIAAELKAHFAQIGYTSSTEISRLTGVPQYGVWRALFNGTPRRLSKTLKKLCEYAQIEVNPPTTDPTQSETLMGALRKVWDGSDEHARQIAELLFAGHNCRMRK